MEHFDVVYGYAQRQVRPWFAKGAKLRGTKLKNYTSGDHDSVGFEEITDKIIHKAVKSYGLTDRTEVNGSYIHDPDGVWESQRLDHHVWIDGKLAIAIEDRAWIDKPFYTLKRGVIRTFMSLPFVKKQLSKHIKFVLFTLAINVTDKTRKTRDLVDGYGDIVLEANLSGRKRGANYFEHGHCPKELRKFVTILCTELERYA
jgi:hypothetical protein